MGHGVQEGVAGKLEERADEKRAPLTAQARPSDLRVHSLFRKYRSLTRPLPGPVKRVDAIFLRSATLARPFLCLHFRLPCPRPVQGTDILQCSWKPILGTLRSQ